ncbi:hypothetical protein JCM8097_009195 [Rhodosporidiobolus ruineniae]
MSSSASPMPVDAVASSSSASPSLKRSRADALLDDFTSYRTELDAHYAQKERCVKVSRDITALSKQLIFALHRIGSGRGKAQVFREAEGKMKDLRALFEKMQAEVQGEAFWRYERSVSPGIQEYLEGFTFYHYLQHHTLPTLAESQASLIPPPPAPLAPAPSADSAATPEASTSSAPPAPPAAADAEQSEPQPYVRVTVDDYLGGVADLTGELMRLAIASVGRNLTDSLGGKAGEEGEGNFANIEYIGRLVREIKGEMDPLAIHCRWLPKKLQVLDQSLGKIENASYNLRIRGAEYKDSPAMLQALARKMAESSRGGGDRDRDGGREVEASA